MATLIVTDSQLLTAIKGKQEERDWALKHFFTNKSLKATVVGYILHQGGNVQDGEDVFQDTVILFDRAIREGNFKEQSSLNTFFVGIAKWRWVSNKRKYGGYVELKPELYDMSIESVEGRFIEDERRKVIDEILTKIGERCKVILKLYKLSYSMEEIAEQLGLSSPELAKKNAYECRKKFKNYLADKPEYKSILNI
jgi:RNA polymerase sigma factor (sigma-70 family)